MKQIKQEIQVRRATALKGETNINKESHHSHTNLQKKHLPNRLIPQAGRNIKGAWTAPRSPVILPLPVFVWLITIA